MIAFKTYSQCPFELNHENVPSVVPFVANPCTLDQVDLYRSQGFSVVSEEEYAEYLLSVQDIIAEWEASKPVLPEEPTQPEEQS